MVTPEFGEIGGGEGTGLEATPPLFWPLPDLSSTPTLPHPLVHSKYMSPCTSGWEDCLYSMGLPAPLYDQDFPFVSPVLLDWLMGTDM